MFVFELPLISMISVKAKDSRLSAPLAGFLNCFRDGPGYLVCRVPLLLLFVLWFLAPPSRLTLIHIHGTIETNKMSHGSRGIEVLVLAGYEIYKTT